MATWWIVVGCALIVLAFFPKGDFYSSDGIGGSVSSPPLPKWLGRLGFIVIGLLLIALGTAKLIDDG